VLLLLVLFAFTTSCEKNNSNPSCINVRLISNNSLCNNYQVLQDINGVLPSESVSEITINNTTYKNVFIKAGNCNLLPASISEGDIFEIKIKSESKTISCPTCTLVTPIKGIDYEVCETNAKQF
jgi:hypothetical protein